MLRACLFLLLFIPFTLFIAASAIIATLVDGSGRLYHLHAKIWSRVGLCLGGVRIEVRGQQVIPDGPVIFMSNHQGAFDIFALFLAVPRQFSWMAKEELFHIPVFGHSMARAGYIPLNRGNGRSALKSINAAADRINKGQSVVIFPEGTRSLDGSLLPFKRGGFLVAAKAGVPIIPCTINGSVRINPTGKLWLHPGVITVSFGAPINAEARNEFEREKVLEEVRDAILTRLES